MKKIGQIVDIPMKNKTVCIVGLGYASLLLANAFVIENKSVEWEDGR